MPESMTRVDSPVPLMHHDPDRSWITNPDPDLDHPKGRQPFRCIMIKLLETLEETTCLLGPVYKDGGLP